MGCRSTIFVLILCCVNAHSSHRKNEKAKDEECISQSLLIKFTTQFEHIWDDKGSDAGGDLSIWRPTSREPGYTPKARNFITQSFCWNQVIDFTLALLARMKSLKLRTSGFFPVGDTAVTSRESPDHAAVLVEDDGNGLVKPPKKFRKIWNDKGSSARRPVTVYEMIPPSNYTCLGDVAVKSYKRCPDRNMYRCVRLDLVENGDIFNLWKSKHFGSEKDVSFWIVKERNSTKSNGVSTGSFLAVKSFDQPVDNMYLLSACKINLTDTETGNDQNDHHKGHHHHGPDACDCLFKAGGCMIGAAPPPDMACRCTKKDPMTCVGEVTGCAQPNAFFCKNPDKSLSTCLQGGGNCRAYSDSCDCEYHPGGCKISRLSVPHTACKCEYTSAWTCGGNIVKCTDATSEKCIKPDTSEESCLQGGGVCNYK